MNPVIYGIPNCDSIKKARGWFESQGLHYTFIDFRKAAPSPAQLSNWCAAVGEKALLNKRSTTWKNLSDQDRLEAENGNALALLLTHPTLIKRPVLEYAGETSVGFNATDYAAKFGR
ncbi:MAG: arsenate reductase [Luminiphilus sp.]|nr:arsenate reductase [Luminiphilus sp.]